MFNTAQKLLYAILNKDCITSLHIDESQGSRDCSRQLLSVTWFLNNSEKSMRQSNDHDITQIRSAWRKKTLWNLRKPDPIYWEITARPEPGSNAGRYSWQPRGIYVKCVKCLGPVSWQVSKSKQVNFDYHCCTTAKELLIDGMRWVVSRRESDMTSSVIVLHWR